MRLDDCRPLLCLGIDPGVRNGGYCVVRFRDVARIMTSIPEWVCCGKFVCAEPYERIAAVVESAGVVESVMVSVEWPRVRMGARTQQQQYAQDRNVERIQAIVRGIIDATASLGVPHITVLPDEWQRALGTRDCRHGAKRDKMLSAALPRLVHGCPARTNTHVRDAAGIAIVGARMLVTDQKQCATNAIGAKAVIDAIVEGR